MATRPQGSIYLAHHLATMVERDELPSVIIRGQLWAVLAVTYEHRQGYRFRVEHGGEQALTTWLDRTQPIEVITS